MKIENIRLFLDVVQYGSINKAAEKNFIAQQNLSVIIKNMEKELNTTLLMRNNAGITLTYSGKEFLNCAKNIVQSYDEYLNTIQADNDNPIIPVYTTLAFSKCLSELQGSGINNKYYLSINVRSFKELRQMLENKEDGLYFVAVTDEDIIKTTKMPNAILIAKESETAFFCHKSSKLAHANLSATELLNQMSVSLLSQDFALNKMITVNTVDSCKKLMIDKGFYCSLPIKLKHILGFDDPEEWIDLIRNQQTFVAYYLFRGKSTAQKYLIAQDYIANFLQQKFNEQL